MEVFIMPHVFPAESGDSAGILWNPQEWKMAEAPAKFSIPVVAYSGGILAFRNRDRNDPRNAQERNATGIWWPEWYF